MADAAHGHGALFLTNIQQIYAQEAPPPPVNPIAAILGNAPKINVRNAESMLDRILRLPNLMVLNDAIKDQNEDASTLDGFSLEMFEDLAFVMWSAAHPEEKYDSPDEWLDQFNTFSIYQILPELIDLWGMNIKTTVPARKN